MLTQYSKDMERVITALDICRKFHEGQVDKCGQPYWLHPFTVAFRTFTGHTTSDVIVGLLHDIVEDTSLSLDELCTLIELTDEEKSALDLLTRKKHIPYAEYIDLILESGNMLAMEVKRNDLLHNIQLSRFSSAGLEITNADVRRANKYSEAIQKLTKKLGGEW